MVVEPLLDGGELAADLHQLLADDASEERAQRLQLHPRVGRRLAAAGSMAADPALRSGVVVVRIFFGRLERMVNSTRIRQMRPVFEVGTRSSGHQQVEVLSLLEGMGGGSRGGSTTTALLPKHQCF